MQMTKELTVFKFNEYTIRRVPWTDGRILYCIADTCAAIGIKKTNEVVNRLTKGAGNNAPLSAEGCVNNAPLPGGVIHIDCPTAGGMQRMAFTDEVGLYDIISKSRKPLAKILYRMLIESVPTMRGSTGRSTPEITSTERVLIDTNNRVKALERTVCACLPCMQQNIAKIQADQMMGVKLLKSGTLPQINDIDWRAKLNQDLRNISLKFNWPEHDCWNMVYYEDKYRNHRDIKAIARNRGCRPIQVAEEKGWLPDLCAIAKAILLGEIVSSYRFA